MRSIFAAFLLSVGVSALLTPMVRRLALLLGAVDAGGGRKVHAGTIPRMGGVAIVVGFYAPLTALLFLDAGINALYLEDIRRVLALFVGGAAITALGVWDDLRGADARKKFAVQFSVGALVYAAGYRVELLSNPLEGGSVDLGMLSLPITLLWVAGVINALNLIDGLDGLAGGVALFVLGTLFALGYLQDRVLVMLFCAALGGATLGFLFYNFNPATIFMGDTGSLFLGFVISVMSIQGSQKSSTAVAVAIPLLALGLPLADTALAMFRRILRGRNPFSADREHIHHKLLDMGLTHRQAVLVLYGACLLLAGAALTMTFLNSAEASALLVAVGLVAVAVFHRMGYLQLQTLRHEVTVGRATTRALRDKRERVRLILEARETPYCAPEFLQGLTAAANVVGFSEVRLTLRAPVLGLESDHVMGANLRNAAEEPKVFTAQYRLDGPSGPLCDVAYTFLDGRTRLSPDDASLLDLLHDALATRLEESTTRSNVVPLKRRTG